MFEGGKHHQRPALMQVGDHIYSGWASHCVQWNFTGWIIGWHATDGRIVTKYAMEGGKEASGKGGGIWMSGGGLASDNPGRMFFATGNGYASQLADDPVPGRQPPTSLEEAVVNMAINSDGSITPTDFFIPWEKRDLDGMDKDLGTSGFVLMEPSVFKTDSVKRIGAVAGKTGKLYFLNVDNLGGYQMGANRKDDILQTVQMAAPVFASGGTYPFEGGYFYVTPVGQETVAFKFGVDPSGKPVFTEAGKTAHKAAGRQGVGHTVVTTMNGEPGTGILWICDVDGNHLRAYGTVPVNGVLPSLGLWNNVAQTKFSRPVFGNGRVYLTTQTGYITAFGSPVNMPFNCSSPYDLGSVQLGSSNTTTVTCIATAGQTRIDSLEVDSPGSFSVSEAPTFPATYNQGQSFTFKATFKPATVGGLSTNINLKSANLGTGKFASNTPVVIRGTGISFNPVLTIQPNVVSFGEVVTGEEATSQSFSIRNGGQSNLIIESYQWSLNATTGPFVPNIPADSPFKFSGLPAVGGTVSGGAESLVAVSFKPTSNGYFSLYVQIKTNGGTANVGIFGTAGSAPKAVLEWQLSTGEWIEWKEGVPFEFDGGVLLGTQRNQKMRLRNTGGTILTTTISKPPVSGPVAAVNALGSIAEGSQIPAGKSEEATIVCSPPKGQVNSDPIELSAVWTLNNNDGTWGKHEVVFRCQGISQQVGPKDGNGQGYYRYAGCYKDADPERQLQENLGWTAGNTNGNCMERCKARYPNFAWAGTEYEGECWCGSKSAKRKVDDTTCNYLCRGDYQQYCGGDGAYMSLFYDRRMTNGTAPISSSSVSSAPSSTSRASSVGSSTGSATGSVSTSASGSTGVSSTTSSTLPTSSPSNYEYVGCASEGIGGRALMKGFLYAADMTLQKCQTYCTSLGQPLSGVEYGSECFCGDKLENNSALGSEKCNMPCSGDASKICGGSSALSVYRQKSSGSSSSISGSSTGSTPSSTSSTVPSSTPSTGALPGWVYQGCANEGVGGRALTKGFLQTADMTLAKCQAHCAGLQMPLAGVEYSTECYCSDKLENASTLGGSTKCNMPCGGATGQICGGPSALSIWRKVDTISSSVTLSGTGSSSASGQASSTRSSTPSPIPSSSTSWTYLGCANEGVGGRALTKGFLYDTNMTLQKCQVHCSELGLSLFGVEYSTECYCGDVLQNTSRIGGSTSCNMKCGGALGEICGGPSALSVYQKPMGGSSSASASRTVSNSGSASSGSSFSTRASVTSLSPAPTGTGSVSGWEYVGCATEGKGGRALAMGFLYDVALTIAKCQTYCLAQGFSMAGMEYSSEVSLIPSF